MEWFYIAMIGPFLYAVCNHIDKVLLEKYFRHSGVGTLILVSALLSILALPILYLIDPSVIEVGSTENLLTLAVLGFINVATLWFYLEALMNEEASIAVVFYQLVPVFGLVLAYYILGEVVTKPELVAMVVIIVGASIVSFDLSSENKFAIRWRTVIFMTIAAFLWGLSSVIFKYVALEEEIWRTAFWEHLAMVVVGIFVFVFIKSYRENFILALKENSGPVLGLNVLNEVLYMIGNISFSYAYMLVPVSLVLLTQSFQPFFVIALGVLMVIVLPKFATEKLTGKFLGQKMVAVTITAFGTAILLFPEQSVVIYEKATDWLL